MKDVMVWSLRLLVLFVVLMGASFLVLTLITPSPEELQEIVAKAEVVTVPDSSGGAMIQMVAGDSLQTVIDSLNSELFFLELRADSLALQVDEKQGEIQILVNQVATMTRQIQEFTDQQASIKDLAKTYETMKVNDIKPILDRVDDDTVIALYTNMGNRTRKNLMQALSSVRAAQITKKIAGTSP